MGPPCTTYRTEIISSMPCRVPFPTFLIPLIPASHIQSTNPLDTVGLGCRRRRLFGSHCQLSQTPCVSKASVSDLSFDGAIPGARSAWA